MIQFLSINQILNFFVNVICFVKWRRAKLENEHDMEIIVMLSMSVRLLLEFLKLAYMAIRIFKLRKNNKRKILVKPHKLIRLMHMYRYLSVFMPS